MNITCHVYIYIYEIGKDGRVICATFVDELDE